MLKLFTFTTNSLTMKKPLLALSFVLGFWFCGSAQWVSIPDTNFGTWLNTNGYSTCLQGNNAVGWQMDTTCSAVTSETSISCSSANIQNLSGIEYFTHLQIFYCTANHLTSLPPLPNSLIRLECFSNQLTLLPYLPNTLTALVCFGNQLNALPSLPDSLITLRCESNQLSALPSLPNTLKELNCMHNQLTALPSLPNSLTDIYCGDNQLTTLPELPDSLGCFSCPANPNLNCLPQLKKIKQFFFSNTGITCLPNYPQSNTGSSPLLSSVPICDIFNQNYCNAFNNINGKAYLDSSLNCIDDSAETPLQNVHFDLYQNGSLISQTNSYNINGSYSFATGTNIYTYSVDTNNLPFILFCPDSGYYTSVITAADSLDTDMNFGFRCKPGFDLVAKSIVARHPLFFPAAITPLIINVGDYSNFYGVRCAVGVGGTVQLVMSGPVTYVLPVSGALTPSNVSGDTVTWNIADFGVVNFFTDFNIMVQTDTTAQIGQLVCFSLFVSPVSGDNNPSNNALDYCGVVVSSYDPNEKEVYPAGDIDTAQKWLTYTIHFQNTGTAEAQHIYVTDTLDSNVDPASFQLLAYSHQPMVQIKENAVRFNFPNINLPDSGLNEPASHGYVQYKVKLKENLPLGTTINNTAFIYFDFNASVVTNTVSNTISTVTNVAEFGMQNLEFRMNPNPASSSVNISVNEEMIGSSLTVYDITGRKMAAVQLSVINNQLSIARFAPGVYFVTVENEKGSVTKKLVIEK